MDPETLATSAPGLYAGGDVAFGPRNLIEAVANGKRAARSIHEYLARDRARTEVTLDIEKIPTAQYRMAAGFELMDREAPPTLEVGRRTGIAEVETGLRAGRGLAPVRALPGLPRADHLRPREVRALQPLRGRLPRVLPGHRALRVARTCPRRSGASSSARAEGEGLPLSAMVKDDDRCIRCGLCAIRCPTDAMTMERFQITERFPSA